MKRLDEFTDSELVGLSEEQIQDLIDVECAFEGARLLPPMPEYVKTQKFDPDITIFKVGDFEVATEEAAMAIINLLRTLPLVSTTYDWSMFGSDYKYIKNEPVPIPDLRSIKVFSEAYYQEVLGKMVKAKQEKDAYEEQMRLYNEITEERSSVADRVFSRLREAKEAIDEQTRIAAQFERYLTLAEGDRTMAIKFLADALKVTAEEAEALVTPPIAS